MQALSESMNVLLQVGPEGISITDPAALPKVRHGLSVLHKQAPHLKVNIPHSASLRTITIPRPAPAITCLCKVWRCVLCCYAAAQGLTSATR